MIRSTRVDFANRSSSSGIEGDLVAQAVEDAAHPTRNVSSLELRHQCAAHVANKLRPCLCRVTAKTPVALGVVGQHISVGLVEQFEVCVGIFVAVLPVHCKASDDV